MSEHECRFTVRPLIEEGLKSSSRIYPRLHVGRGTTAEAVASCEDAKRRWTAAMKKADRPISPPSTKAAEGGNGKRQLRARKSRHPRLAEHANREGVTLNTLAVRLLAEGLGEGSAHGD
jgi:antitoxin HicB